VLIPVRIGLGVPRRIGDPSGPFTRPNYHTMVRYGQLAESLGFDSVWVPDHFYYEWPPGVFEPYPEAWTLLTAIGAITQRVQIGTMALAAGFRHPAMLAKMAGALQHLTDGRLVLGIGAGNQRTEHTPFGMDFDGRVSRLTEYLQILRGLLANEYITLNGRYYTLGDASLLQPRRRVPIWVAGSGPRMLSITAVYASGWNWADGFNGDGASFRSALAQLRLACERHGRNLDDIEISSLANVLVLPDAAETRALIDRIGATTGWPSAKVRDRYVIGTPDEVARRLALAVEWGVNHLVCSIGGRPFTLWSDAMLELFAREVLPRLRPGATRGAGGSLL
jgi:alkanesulfonate monooxygenase SsuD/methylene tetrahydromethanopterin reductase-like flavin-dependent oxidoreductase (luciferase family)